MRFIPKQKEVLTESIQQVVLQETEANPLDKAVENSNEDEAYKQAILRAIGSETAADVEYSQILNLEDKVSDELKKHFHDTIVDIRNEEIKHIAQLTEKVSELPDMKDAFEAGKKEAETGKDVKEAVQQDRMYDVENIKQIIAEYLDLNTDQYVDMEDIFKYVNDDLTAEEVDKYLAQVVELFELSPEQLHDIEINIVASSDPMIDRQADFKSDINDDIDTLEYVKEKLHTIAAHKQIDTIIDYLKALEYNGNADIGWTLDHGDFNNPNKKRNIVS